MRSGKSPQNWAHKPISATKTYTSLTASNFLKAKFDDDSGVFVVTIDFGSLNQKKIYFNLNYLFFI